MHITGGQQSLLDTEIVGTVTGICTGSIGVPGVGVILGYSHRQSGTPADTGLVSDIEGHNIELGHAVTEFLDRFSSVEVFRNISDQLFVIHSSGEIAIQHAYKHRCGQIVGTVGEIKCFVTQRIGDTGGSMVGKSDVHVTGAGDFLSVYDNQIAAGIVIRDRTGAEIGTALSFNLHIHVDIDISGSNI